MSSKTTRHNRSDCPLNVALEVLGDAWTLLIVRDLMFKNCNSFNALLNAKEGIATNILSDRLSRLEGFCIIERQRDAQDARRWVYRLTEKGIDLAPILVEMLVWGARFENSQIAPETLAKMQADPRGFAARIKKQWLNQQTQSPAQVAAQG